jgi:hypothetical protein
VSSVSNVLYFLTLPLVSIMRVIYASKGMSKSLGCALYIRCALSIEKYGNVLMKIKYTLLINSKGRGIYVDWYSIGVSMWTGTV